MRKKIIEDITTKRSIKNISLDRDRKNISSSEMSNDKIVSILPEKNLNTSKVENYNLDYDNDNTKKESRIGLWISLAIFLLALAFGLSTIFANVKVSIVLKKDSFPLKQTVSVKKDQPAGEFGYQLITIEDSVTRSINGLLDQDVKEKAYGTITIYNEEKTPQTLISNTRFESSSGLIFRIKEKITIPAKKTSVGAYDVVVYADEPGEKYNIPPTDFTVPGLKGDARYKTIYAKSKTEMKNGFSGTKKVLDENSRKTANIEMSADLKKKLLLQLKTQIPENLIFYQNTIEYDFSEPTETNIGTEIKLSKTGKINVFLFDRRLLSNKLISLTQNKIDYPAMVENLGSLDISVAKENEDQIKLTINGDISIISILDKNVLKDDLLGINKDQFQEILKNKYFGIKEARIKIFPFWKDSIPDNPKKIDIKEVPNL